jgi:hypothetical protein
MDKYCYVGELKSSKKQEKHGIGDEILKYVKFKKEGYEIIKENNKVMPYFEYDIYHETEEVRASNFETDKQAILNELSTCYDLDKAQVLIFSSNGLDTDKKQYKNSIHVLIRGLGYFKNNQNIVKPKDGKFDNTVYKPYQKFRLPFCSKKGQNRFKNLLYNNKIYDVNNFAKSGLKYENLLITYTGDEEEFVQISDSSDDSDSDSSGDSNDDSDDDDSDDDDSDDDSDMKIDIEEFRSPVKKLIYPFSTVQDFQHLTNLINTKKRIEDWKNWMKVMRLCKNIYKTFKDDEKIRIREQIHILMARDLRKGKYSKKEVDEYLDREDKKESRIISWGTLCRIAKEDNEDKYESYLNRHTNNKSSIKKKKISSDDHFNITRIEKLQKQPRKYYWCDNTIFNNSKHKKPDEILKYLVDTSFKICDGGQVSYVTINKSIKKFIDNKPVYAYEMKTLKQNPFEGNKRSVNFKLNGEKTSLYKFSQEFFDNFYYSSTEMLPYTGVKDPFKYHKAVGNSRILNKFEAFNNAYYEYINPNVTCDRLLWHIRNIICNNEDNSYNYLIGWLAFLLQKPNIKHETCILLQAEEGAGKNVFVEIIKLLIGKHFCYDTGEINDIIGGFNHHLSGKLIVIGDELISYAGFKKSDAIKNMTTCPNINVTKKGIDTIQESSYHRYIFTTNNIETLRITNKDRRILVLGVSNTKIGDHKYFEDLYEEINNPDAIKKLFDFLIEYDLSNFNFRKAPLTKLKQEMIVSQLDDIYDWFVNYAVNLPIDNGNIKITRNDAIENYREYTKIIGMRPKDFVNKIIRLLKCDYRRFSKCNCFIFKVDKTNNLLRELMNLNEDPLRGNDEIPDSDDEE